MPRNSPAAKAAKAIELHDDIKPLVQSAEAYYLKELKKTPLDGTKEAQFAVLEIARRIQILQEIGGMLTKAKGTGEFVLHKLEEAE